MSDFMRALDEDCWIGEEKENASRVLREHRLEDLNIIGAPHYRRSISQI